MTHDEYIRHLAATSVLVEVDGAPWGVQARKLAPLTPPHLARPFDPKLVRSAMRRTGAMAALWHDAWDTAPCDWWWCCCDDAKYDVERFDSSGRRHVRIGLRRCQVRRVETEWLAENGYPIFAAAARKYGQTPPPGEERRFADLCLKEGQYSGREPWCAFVDGKLAAYAKCIVVDDVVYLSAEKSDLAYRQAMPNNALAYTLTRHYMRERGMRLVIDGWRTVLHPTNFQDFLEMMGYRKIYCPLRLALHPALATAMAIGMHRWGGAAIRKLAPGLWQNLQAIGKLHSIAKACANCS